MKVRNTFARLNNKFAVAFISIFLLATFLRTYKLTQAPAGYFFDEVAVGVNSLYLANNLTDEFGNRFPDFIKIGDDYRHAGIFYITAPFVKILGLNIFSVRLATATFGVATVAAIFFLAFLLTKNETIAFLSMAATAVSPWLTNLSRSSNEVVIALFFLVLATIFFLLAQNGKKIFFALVYLSLLLAWFSYSAAIMLTLLYSAAFVLYTFLAKAKKEIKVAALIVFAALIIFPNLFYTITKPQKITGRFNSVSIFATKDPQLILNEQLREDGIQNVLPTPARIFHNKLINYFQAIANNYSLYFSGPFLFGTQGGPPRYRIPNAGLIYYLDIPFFLVGAYFIFKKFNLPNSLLLFLLFVGAVPASLTVEDIPNIQRSIFMAPGVAIIIAAGIYYFFATKLKNKKIGSARKFLPPILLLGYVYLVTFFMHQLIYHQPKHQNWGRNSEWPQAAKIIDANIGNYKQANIYETIGHYFLFFYSSGYRTPILADNNLQQQYITDRNLYADWSLGKYYFRHEKCIDKGQIKADILYSVGQNCQIPSWARVIGEAKTSDGVTMLTFLDVPYDQQTIDNFITVEQSLQKK